MEIIWTKLARITYDEVLENLKDRWTFREMIAFYELTDEVIQKIKQNEVEFPDVSSQFKVKKAIIHTTVSLYFKRQNDKIYLITFFNNRMNPKTLSKLLKH